MPSPWSTTATFGGSFVSWTSVQVIPRWSTVTVSYEGRCVNAIEVRSVWDELVVAARRLAAACDDLVAEL